MCANLAHKKMERLYFMGQSMSVWLFILGGFIRKRKRKQVISREENLRSQIGAGLGRRVGSEQPNQEYTGSRKDGAIRDLHNLERGSLNTRRGPG